MWPTCCNQKEPGGTRLAGGSTGCCHVDGGTGWCTGCGGTRVMGTGHGTDTTGTVPPPSGYPTYAKVLEITKIIKKSIKNQEIDQDSQLKSIKTVS